MERLGDLLFELSNEDRLKILYELKKENLRLSHISKRLDFTAQETSRNIARLVEVKLVTRTKDGSYEISPYGIQAIRLIPGYQFLSKYSDYFYTHSLENLSQKFVSRIGELIECKLVAQLLEVFANIERVFKEAEEYYIYIGEPLALSSTIILSLEALDRGVKGKCIEPVGYEWPVEIRESVPEETWNSFIKHFADKSFQRRYLDKFDVTFLINEKEVAILNFINPTGEFEYMGFTSNDKKAVEWCKDVFEYYWERAAKTGRRISIDRIEVTGTHKGEYRGLAPMGKKMTVRGVQIYRIVDGKAVEGWTDYNFYPDQLDLLKQLGLIEYTEKAKKLLPYDVL